MTPSQRIMKKKGRFKAEIDRRLPKAQSDALWQKATDKLSTLLEQYAFLSAGVRFHTENKIFPAAAIYLTIKECIGQNEAYQVMEDATFKTADAAAKKLAALLCLPGMRSLFVKAWDPLTRKVFGENSGFQKCFLPEEKRRVPDGRGLLPIQPLFYGARMPGAHEDFLRSRRPCLRRSAGFEV